MREAMNLKYDFYQLVTDACNFHHERGSLGLGQYDSSKPVIKCT